MRRKFVIYKINLALFLTLFFISFLICAYSNKHSGITKSVSTFILESSYPVSYAFSDVLDFFYNIWDGYIALVDVEQNNKKLKQRLRLLEAKNLELKEQQFENQRLKQILKFASMEKESGRIGNVISYGIKTQQQIVQVDLGLKDSIKEGQVVVDGTALVGQISSVGLRSSKVLLIKDPLSSVDSFSQNSRIRGILQGRAGDYLSFNYVSKDENVQLGDRIISSGLDGIFPKGLLLGVVISVDNQTAGLFQEILVRPASSLSKLETVYILD